MKKILVVFLLIILCMTACTNSLGNNSLAESSSSLTFSSSEESDVSGNGNNLTSFTPTQILNLYCESLKKGDLETLNSLFTNDWITKNGEYQKLNPQDIYDINIREEEPVLSKSLSSNEVIYSAEFKIKDGDFFFDMLINGEEYYCYFFNMVKEDNIWKINNMGTSP